MNRWKIQFVMLCALVALTGCNGNRGYIKQAIPENSLTFICDQRNIPWQWDSASHILTFSSQGVPSKVLVGSKLVLVGDRQILLSYPVERKYNTIVVPADFIRRVFGTAEEKNLTAGVPPVLATGKFRTIMLDPGHGGYDSGALGVKGTVEKEIVLDIALKLKAQLEGMGFKVVMTRDSDDFISLQQRTEMATEKKVDLFLSIHANSVKSRSKKVKGMEIYYARKLEADTDIAQRRHNEEMLFKKFLIPGDRKVPEKILSDLMYVNKMEDSPAIADKIIARASKDVSAANRGCRSSGFFVVKNTLVPAVLFEVGYVTSESEAKLLKTQEYRQKIADTIAESVKEFNNES